MRACIPYFFVFVSALGLNHLAAAAAPTAADLIGDSPFVPAGNSAPVAVTEGAAIELHGIMTTAEGTSFSIYDTAKKSAQWVRVNQAGSPFLVRSHNIVDGNDEVKVDYQGNSLTLALKTPKIGAMTRPNPAVVQMGPVNRAGFTGTNPITQTVVVNPTPADEAARLQAVVDAVAARRAARNQAVQQQQGANPMAAPVVQPTMQQSTDVRQNQNNVRANRPRQGQR